MEKEGGGARISEEHNYEKQCTTTIYHGSYNIIPSQARQKTSTAHHKQGHVAMEHVYYG